MEYWMEYLRSVCVYFGFVSVLLGSYIYSPACFIHTLDGWNCQANGGALYTYSFFFISCMVGGLIKMCGFICLSLWLFWSFSGSAGK